MDRNYRVADVVNVYADMVTTQHACTLWCHKIPRTDGGFGGKITCKWSIFHCHDWLPEGRSFLLMFPNSVSPIFLDILLEQFFLLYRFWIIFSSRSPVPSISHALFLQDIPMFCWWIPSDFLAFPMENQRKPIGKWWFYMVLCPSYPHHIPNDDVFLHWCFITKQTEWKITNDLPKTWCLILSFR